MVEDFVSDAMSLKEFLPRFIIETIKIKKKRNVRFDILNAINIVCRFWFRIGGACFCYHDSNARGIR